MTWKTHLTDAERLELHRLEEVRDKSREAFNAARRKLQSRCESRMRQIAKKDAEKSQV